MNKLLITVATVAAISLAPAMANKKATETSPEEDLKAYQDYFVKRFNNDVPLNEFQNGVYAIDKVSRENWEAIEEFPPYEPFIEEGEAMWNTPFANGKSYSDCFPDGPAIQSKYPYWDADRKMVMTLALALNECREANGEKPLKYKKGPIATLLAYIAYESRGQKTNVVIPEGDADALAAYNAGQGRVRQWERSSGHLSPILFHQAIPFDETYEHIRKVIVSTAWYGYLYQGRAPATAVELILGPGM
jgi:sulfur-oxidizing protein SoxA